MEAKIFTEKEHGIEHNLIDPDALYVVRKLREAGFEAYIVGGSVRDLLIKQIPKDFDISTSARPEQIKGLFHRQCLLIGRRFRLAHIRFGHKILEVSTFRSGITEGDLILQDNVWGNAEEDVLRRDFTINGLFYDASNHTVIDYVGGWEDIKKNTIRTIGNPVVRFRQDPVRMIRLIKFKARFNFEIDPESEKALNLCREDIVKSSPARILEEIFRMLESGSSSSFFHLMAQSGLLELLFPCLTHFIEQKKGKEIFHYLASADEINKANPRHPLDRAILTACLLYPILEQEIQTQYLDKEITPHIGQIMMVTSSLIKGFVTSSFSHFPKRISTMMSFILATQYRLTPLSGKRHPRHKLLSNKEFRHALHFLKIRALVHSHLMPAYTSWKEMYRQTNP